MNLDNLESYLDKYIKKLYRTKEIRNIDRVCYWFERSQKSKSIYLRLVIKGPFRNYKKTLRFSDHEYKEKGGITKYNGVVVSNGNKIKKSTLNYAKQIIKKEIKKLIHGAEVNTIYRFKADRG